MARQNKKDTASANKKATSKQKNFPAHTPVPFFKFIVKDKSCLRFLLAGAVITIIYFILLRVLYPIGSFYFDSMAYIEAASRGMEVSYRPIGYSNFISFFHSISQSDGMLIFAQYISNVIANLFLFFTLLYFFSLKKSYRVLLFILLICNPLYVIYSNYILSDAFFCSLSVIWFTVLLWIIYRPRWVYLIIQLVLLYFLFLLRYNALIYPFIAAVAYVLSKQVVWKKAVSICITFLLIIEMINTIIDKTEDTTGTAAFSAFGGWQLANNSMFVLKHVKPDSTAFNTETSKEICVFINNYYDTLKMKGLFNDDDDVNATYIWSMNGPLKRYMYYHIPQFYAMHPPRETINRYLSSWTIMGPVFEEFGTEVIKKYPLEYLHYYVWPNIRLYCHPPVELYNSYNENADTLNPLATTYYNYPSNKIDKSNAGLLPVLMGPWSWLFTIINALFILLTAAYYFRRGYKNDAWFNRCLVFYLAFYALNFLFNIVAAPTYFRFYITIVTLSMVFIVYLWQRVFNPKMGFEPANRQG
jgi:hypothetical protein